MSDTYTDPFSADIPGPQDPQDLSGLPPWAMSSLAQQMYYEPQDGMWPDPNAPRKQLPDVGPAMVGDGGQFSAGNPTANRMSDLASQVAYQAAVPQSLTDLGLMAATGGGSVPYRMGALAAGTMLDPDEAKAGKGGAAKAIGKTIGEILKVAPADPILPGDLRVSTRFPTAVKAPENPLTHQLSIGADEMAASPGYEHNVSLLSNYPGFAHLKGMDPQQAMQAYMDQARGNLQYLYANSPQTMKERSPLWYEGAHEISDALANRWGVPRPSASGALASLSPQMDWFKNASLGERTGDIMTSAAAGKILTPEMAAFHQNSEALNKPKNLELFRSIQGKSLDQLDDPLQKALWIRLYDEAHHARAYREITPEGNYGGFILNKDGTPAKIGWGALGEIEKAVRSLQSGGDPSVISPILGTKHKVRSFYNNIEVPNDVRYGDVTADTHQVAAAQMRPLSGSSEAVQHNLASGGAKGATNAASSAVSGVQGTYGLVADATRMMAMDHDMLPRAAQSATWEPVRQLFPATFKTDKNATAVDDIWRAYDRGEISVDQARDKIFDFAGGIAEPGWARPGLKTSAPRRSSTYR